VEGGWKVIPSEIIFGCSASTVTIIFVSSGLSASNSGSVGSLHHQ
jgi:hypothetical protein